MKEKLNLKFDHEVIAAAKNYAKRNKTSVSLLVERYFRSIARPMKKKYVSEELTGCLKHLGQLSDRELKELHLKNKHHV